jgi:hypothetical protein
MRLITLCHSPGIGWRNWRSDGYQGVSLRFCSQRQQVSKRFKSQTGLPRALARCTTAVSTLMTRSDRVSHFAAYSAIDIALDPFPHAGGMTTLDALWTGVPVVTWAGKSVSSRWAATSLAPLGLTDFIADGPESYVALAIAKTADLEALTRLGASLRTRMATSDWATVCAFAGPSKRHTSNVTALVLRANRVPI